MTTDNDNDFEAEVARMVDRAIIDTARWHRANGSLAGTPKLIDLARAHLAEQWTATANRHDEAGQHLLADAMLAVVNEILPEQAHRLRRSARV